MTDKFGSQGEGPAPDIASHEHLLWVAGLMAEAAAIQTLPRFRLPIAVDNKLGDSGFDPVTIADKEAEAAMREVLAEHCPEDGILGEEFGTKAGSSGRVWILDPVDGTRAFITGVPQWGTLIGVQEQGKAVFGLVDQPFLKERYTGSDLGAFRQYDGGPAKKLSVRECSELSGAIMLTTSPDMFSATELLVFEQLRAKVKLSRYGGDCYAYCMLASGFVDLVVESDLQAYDIQPLIPLIEASGGLVTDWSGQPVTAGGQVIASADRRVHQQALDLLQCVSTSQVSTADLR